MKKALMILVMLLVVFFSVNAFAQSMEEVQFLVKTCQEVGGAWRWIQTPLGEACYRVECENGNLILSVEGNSKLILIHNGSTWKFYFNGKTVSRDWALQYVHEFVREMFPD